MTFLVPVPKAKIDGKWLFAGSADAHHFDRTRGKFVAVVRHKGSPHWECPHEHDTSQEARDCAGRWLALKAGGLA